jgi:hypothetical protein
VQGENRSDCPWRSPYSSIGEILSPLTTEHSKFWDAAHFRLPVAYRLIDDPGHIVDTRSLSAANLSLSSPCQQDIHY